MAPRVLEWVLAHPLSYIVLQRLVGGTAVRMESIDALSVRTGERVLDVGCGPVDYLDRFPPCDYHGFDISKPYIAHARRRWGSRGHFYAETYTEERRQELPPFDAVIMLGLLHHVDDATAHELLGLAARSLQPGGRMVTMDTVLYEGQPRVSELLSKNDRGDHVRSPAAFTALAKSHFGNVEHRLVGDDWAVIQHLMMLSEPRLEPG